MFAQIAKAVESAVEYFIFASRWLQAVVYMGLIFGTALYVYKFLGELMILLKGTLTFSEVHFMLGLLGLIDISMVMNLLIIIIIGGYSIFTSKLDFDGHEDKPQWIDHLDADRLKVKLSTSLASISGVHLLKTFIDLFAERSGKDMGELTFEIVIHMVFIVSAAMLAWIVKIFETPEETPV